MAWLLLLPLLVSFALAEEVEPEPEPDSEPPAEPFSLDLDLDLALPSALERFDPAVDTLSREGAPELEALTSELPELGALDALVDGGGLLRGRFGARPRLAWSGRFGEPGGGLRGGLVLRHQWWSLLPVGPTWVGESQLAGSIGFAGQRGPGASLQSVAGAWLGPVALAVGPRLAWDRIAFNSGDELEPGLSLGPILNLGAELGPVALQLGAGPCWLLTGEREPAALPLGDEWMGAAALGLDRGVLRWTINGQVRETAAGTLGELSLGFNLALD
jgi:hypothetical protein